MFEGLRFAPVLIDPPEYEVPEYEVRDGASTSYATTSGSLADGIDLHGIADGGVSFAQLRRAGNYVVVSAQEAEGFSDVWLWRVEEYEAAGNALHALAAKWGRSKFLPANELRALDAVEARHIWELTAPVAIDPETRRPIEEALIVPGGTAAFREALESTVRRDGYIALDELRPSDVRFTVYLDRQGTPEWIPLAHRDGSWHLTLADRFVLAPVLQR